MDDLPRSLPYRWADMPVLIALPHIEEACQGGSGRTKEGPFDSGHQPSWLKALQHSCGQRNGSRRPRLAAIASAV